MKQLALNPIELATSTLRCSQAQLADKIGVSRYVIYTWKARCAVPTKYLRKVCEVTSLPPHLLNSKVPAFGVAPAHEEDNHD